MFRWICLLLLISGYELVYTQDNVQCSTKFEPMENFQPEKINGLWYIDSVKKGRTILQKIFGIPSNSRLPKCIRAINVQSADDVLYVIFIANPSQINRRRNKFMNYVLGKHNPRGATILRGYSGRKTLTQKYNILDTDYDNYSINIVCDERRQDSIWILKRKPDPLSEDQKQSISKSLEKINETMSNFRELDTNSCPK